MSQVENIIKQENQVEVALEILFSLWGCFLCGSQHVVEGTQLCCSCNATKRS